MWKQNLNLETDISVKELSELEALKASGQYDLMRRGLVLPTSDETVSLATIFGHPTRPEPLAVHGAPKKPEPTPPADETGNDAADDFAKTDDIINVDHADDALTREETAVLEFNAIPLYFPMSYSLVKPYVKGFEINPLDAPVLRDISIDNSWQPRAGR